MTSTKRKSGPTNESFVRSKPVPENVGPPPKRVRRVASLNEARKTHDGSKHDLSSTYVQSLKISKFNVEEAAFPRGGASLLTPLEHKQIHIEAARDVLFESQIAPRRQVTQGDKLQNLETVESSYRKLKSGAKGRKVIQAQAGDEENIKIEGLSYKRLVPGSLVLGQVSQINSHDIALALPNNLTGYVPITSISDTLAERLEKVANNEVGSESDTKFEDEDIQLRNIFSVGQYLRAFVVSTSDKINNTFNEKPKRRIELSLRPTETNGALAKRDLIPNSMVMASVMSIEDHGLVMDLGFADSGVRGFMSTKELGHKINALKLQEGAVLLCMITGLSSNGKIVKLSADTQKIGNIKKSNYLAEAPSVDAFLPGTAVELLITNVNPKGISGKVMGMIDVTADLIHSGAGTSRRDLEKKYKIGTKIKARVLCTFPNSVPRKVGVSLLNHILSLTPQQAQQDGHRNPADVLPVSTIVNETVVKKVEAGVGLFVDLGVKDVLGFVHISRVADEKLDFLSESTGPYNIESVHRSRVVGYNSIDGVYLASLEKRILEQAFLRIEDIGIGEIVKGKVEKLIINSNGVGGLLIALADGITGLVPEIHMADVPLLHPERKFKEGMNVIARVLSTDPGRRNIRLTLKKTLLNSEASPIRSYADITPGMQSPGTIVNILQSGAVVQFYGTVRGFLPVSEMSEAYIQDPNQHFRIGQVVNVYVLKVDIVSEKLTVSCKDPSNFGLAQQNALKALKIGDIISAVVMEKSPNEVTLQLEQPGIRAILPTGHLTDGSDSKNTSALRKIRVGQTLQNLLVVNKIGEKRLLILTNKPSLINAMRDETLLQDFGNVKVGMMAQGFVKNITPSAVFVEFGGGLVGLLPKAKLSEEALRLPDFGLRRFQSLTARVLSVDKIQRRFFLFIKDVDDMIVTQPESDLAISSRPVSNPVDDSIKSLDEFELGKLTTARIISIKETQINLQLADNLQGRVDVSQVFDSWNDIKDRKHPLRNFTSKQIIPVRIIGIHDARNHRFLPVTHRTAKTPVFELSAKPSDQSKLQTDILTLDKVEVGSSWITFVNNIGDDCVWVNLSPNVRGRIRILDISEDVSLLQDLETNFPVGSAIRAHVIGVDVVNSRLDLSARSAFANEPSSFQNLSQDMVLPGKVTRVNERQIMVQLSDKLSGPVHLTDLADNFAEADPRIYAKNDVVRVCVTEIDIPNKRIRLSTRPSRVLNSSLSVKDPEITSVSQLKINDVVRGFVKNVADNGIFISLGGNVTGYVRISDLSDSYIKDWKAGFQIDQLVTGKIIRIVPELNHVQLSLKSSIIDKNYIPPVTFDILKVGQVVTGKVRKVEEFGVFIVIDRSANVSGLCHKSEMAEKGTKNVQNLYQEGDAVKAKILRVDSVKRRISFGLKAAYFNVDDSSDHESNESDSVGVGNVGLKRRSSDDEGNEDAGRILLNPVIRPTGKPDLVNLQTSGQTVIGVEVGEEVPSLNTGGFDWTGGLLDHAMDQTDFYAGDDVGEVPKKTSRRRPVIKTDKTGELDTYGPQSATDFERLLIGQPDSSEQWIEYIAYQVNLGELDKARGLAERALQTINIREETEKMNIWIALLNLENAYGDDESTDEVFKRACQYNDAQEIHERLTSIYIQSGKHKKADELFQTVVKKFSQSPSVWHNYAHFLHQTVSSPDRARLLLPRAIQSLPPHTHLSLSIKFAALEFNSSNGSPERGRTMFEGIVATFPKRLDIWNQLLDLEIHQGDREVVHAIFERVVRIKGLKPRGAKAWFKRWSQWEEKNGDSKSQETVRAKAQEWIRALAETKE